MLCSLFFNCTPVVGRASDCDGTNKAINFTFFFFWGGGGGVRLCCLAVRDLSRWAAYCMCESSFLIYHGVYYDSFVFP